MRLDISRKVTLSAMVVALTVLCLYAASVLPWPRIAFYFMASLFIYALSCEHIYGFALMAYLGAAGIAFLILPDKTPLFAYVALLGHFGIFRSWIAERVADPFSRGLLRLIYCNFFTLCAMALMLYIFDVDLMTYLPEWQLWVLLAVLQAIFIAYDLCYALGEKLYDECLRSRILPRR